LHLIKNSLKYGKQPYSDLLDNKIHETNNILTLSNSITEIIEEIGKKIVLLIDEVDRASNFDVFIKFLGMLRNKYLATRAGQDITFHSVILAGVHDIKTLKLKMRDDKDSQSYNSPWNIAIDFKVDMSFKPNEIATMLDDYCKETDNKMNIDEISERLYFWTSGYPFLVSKLCKTIDEEIIVNRENKAWSNADIDKVVNDLLYSTNTLFDDMGKNLENNPELYSLISSIIIGNREPVFDLLNPQINLAHLFGYIGLFVVIPSY
jgi:hypothetical protein